MKHVTSPIVNGRLFTGSRFGNREDRGNSYGGLVFMAVCVCLCVRLPLTYAPNTIQYNNQKTEDSQAHVGECVFVFLVSPEVTGECGQVQEEVKQDDVAFQTGGHSTMVHDTNELLSKK